VNYTFALMTVNNETLLNPTTTLHGAWIERTTNLKILWS